MVLVGERFVVGVIAVYTFFEEIYSMFKSKGYWKVLSFFNILISALMILRLAGGIKHLVKQNIHQDCFTVEEGALVQDAFAVNCLQSLDYAIIVLFPLIIVLSLMFCCCTSCFQE